MTNPFKDTDTTYFQIPQAVVETGLLAKLRPVALKMYAVLLWLAQKHTNFRLYATNEDFREHAGLVPNSVHDGRVQLQELGLVNHEKGQRGKFIYTVLNPATGEVPRHKSNTGQAAPPKPARSRTVERDAGQGGGKSADDFIWSLSGNDVLRYFDLRLPSERRRRTSDGFMVLCPFHQESTPSLHIKLVTKEWYCHGCKVGGGLIDFEIKKNKCNRSEALVNIADLLGKKDMLAKRTTALRTHSYFDEQGKLLFQVLRYPDQHGEKRWKQRRPAPNGKWIPNLEGVRRVLYKLPQVIAADTVFITEGESDADNLEAALPADKLKPTAVTTAPGGAGKWDDSYSEFLRGKTIYILPDNDDAGRNHAQLIARAINRIARKIAIVYLPDLPEKGDVSDYLREHDIQDFKKALKQAVVWTGDKASV